MTKLLSHVTASGKQRNPVEVHGSSSLELEGMLRVTQRELSSTWRCALLLH